MRHWLAPPGGMESRSVSASATVAVPPAEEEDVRTVPSRAQASSTKRAPAATCGTLAIGGDPLGPAATIGRVERDELEDHRTLGVTGAATWVTTASAMGAR